MNILIVIDPSLYNLVVPMNLDLEIFSPLGWVSIISTYSFMALVSFPSMIFQPNLCLTLWLADHQCYP